jgi:hypothetical protein
VGDDRGHNREARPILFRNGRQLSVADLLAMVELAIRQIAAACISKNSQLGLFATLAKATPCPHRGFARMRAGSIRTHSAISVDSNNLRRPPSGTGPAV